MTDLPEGMTEALLVRPGDTLIVRMDQSTPHDFAVRFKAKLAAELPGIEVLVVGAEQILAYRSGDRET